MTVVNLSPEESIFFLVTRGALSLSSTFKKVLVKHQLPEIKPSYLGVLLCLWEKEALDEMLSKFGSEDGMKLSDLGRCAGVEPSTITGLVDRMEKDGLVSRSPVPGDRRAQQANLTENGRLIRDKVLAAINDFEQDAFEGISENDMEITKQVLRKLIANAAS